MVADHRRSGILTRTLRPSPSLNKPIREPLNVFEPLLHERNRHVHKSMARIVETRGHREGFLAATGLLHFKSHAIEGTISGLVGRKKCTVDLLSAFSRSRIPTAWHLLQATLCAGSFLLVAVNEESRWAETAKRLSSYGVKASGKPLVEQDQ